MLVRVNAIHIPQSARAVIFTIYIISQMNVGSILNGDSPPDDSDRNATSLGYRHSINDLLNGPASNGSRAAPDAQKTLNGESERKVEKEVRTEKDEEKNGKDLENEDEKDGEDESEIHISESEFPSKTDDEESEEELTRADILAVVVEEDAKAASEKPLLVGSELEKISKLKSEENKDGKPKRYTQPPVWAQEWYPSSQQPRDIANLQAESSSMEASGGLSSKPVFDRSHMYTQDLECLVTGVIPPQSIVRTIAEWIYANFVEIPLENRQYVELELKFGTIVDKAGGYRLDIGVSSECIYTKSSEVRFDMGVHEMGWNDMRRFLDELEKTYQDEIRKNHQKPRRKFSKLETDITDLLYVINERNERPKKIRISKDNTLNPPRYAAIEKKRLSDLFIHCPSSMYDLRFSLSLEMPVAEEKIEPTLKKRATSTRIKRRTSFTHTPTVTQFDFTAVLTPKTTKNKAGKTVVEHETNYELELEIDTNEIFRGFDKIRDGSDSIRFEELVEVFLNNARCLNNRVTKLASK